MLQKQFAYRTRSDDDDRILGWAWANIPIGSLTKVRAEVKTLGAGLTSWT